MKWYFIKNVLVNIEEEKISFEGEGEGASGIKAYSFEFKYYLPVLPKVKLHSLFIGNYLVYF